MKFIALTVGGFIGTILRYELGELIPSFSNGFPFNILIINLAGCFFLGLLFTAAFELFHLRPEIRLGLGTGIIGSFTTFSTFTVQSVDLLQMGHYYTAALYIVLSVFGGLLLTLAGVALAKKMQPRGEAAA